MYISRIFTKEAYYYVKQDFLSFTIILFLYIPIEMIRKEDNIVNQRVTENAYVNHPH